MLDIDSSSQTAHISRRVIAKDDRAHRRLAGSTLAHEKDLLFLMFLGRFHFHDFCVFSDLAVTDVTKRIGAVRVLRCRTTAERIETWIVADQCLCKRI